MEFYFRPIGIVSFLMKVGSHISLREKMFELTDSSPLDSKLQQQAVPGRNEDLIPHTMVFNRYTNPELTRRLGSIGQVLEVAYSRESCDLPKVHLKSRHGQNVGAP